MTRTKPVKFARLLLVCAVTSVTAGASSASELTLPHKCQVTYMCMHFTPDFSQCQRTRAFPISLEPGNILNFEGRMIPAERDLPIADENSENYTTEPDSFGLVYKIKARPFRAKIEVYNEGELRGSYDADCGYE